ncbi:MAG: RNA polymerase factor sigma-32 [Parvibaculum sp.]
MSNQNSFRNNASTSEDRRFIKVAMAHPLLSAERERELALKWRDEEDAHALHQLTSAYIRLVVSMASRFRNYGLPLSDLIQEGNIGLMQAAMRFEPERELRFSTYATWWIRASMQDFVLRNWSIVRTGTTSAQKKLFFNLRRMKSKIRNGTSDQLTAESRNWIATELGVKPQDVEQMDGRLSAGDRSLDVSPGTDADESNASWLDRLVSDAPTPEENLIAEDEQSRAREWIQGAFKMLNEREQAIITHRQLKDETVTLEQLGKKFGISKERVRQIEGRAMQKLKDAITSQQTRQPHEPSMSSMSS